MVQSTRLHKQTETAKLKQKKDLGLQPLNYYKKKIADKKAHTRTQMQIATRSNQ